MEVLLPFASNGMQGIPGGVELLQRAAAGGFVALTDKMAALNGNIFSRFNVYLAKYHFFTTQMVKLTLWTARGSPRYSVHASTTILRWSNFLSTNIMPM